MIIKFTSNGNVYYAETDHLEIEGVYSGTIRDGKWILDGHQITKAVGDTYTASEGTE